MPLQISGKMHFIMGYIDNDFFKSILSKTNSSWIQISEVPDDPKTLNMFESNRM